MQLACLYHLDGRMEVIKDENTYAQLQESEEWYASPKDAWEYKYKHLETLWTPRQSACLTVGEDPTKILSPKATQRYLLIKHAHDENKLKFEERRDFEGVSEWKTLNKNVITWAVDNGIDIPNTFLELLEPKERPVSKDMKEAYSSIGSKGAKKSNERHENAKIKAVELAEKYWLRNPSLTKDEVAEKILLDFEEDKIRNFDEPYSLTTVKEWISDVLPENKKKGGRPKAIKNQ